MKGPSSSLPLIKTADQLIKKIDDKLFIEERVAFDTYKHFDFDHDGYVSDNDIKNTIIKNNWLEPEEAERFTEYVDPKKVGFTTFKQFSKMVRNNMTNWDENGISKEPNIMQPSSELVKKRTTQASTMSKTLTSLKNSFRPDINGRKPFLTIESDGKSRYGMTPQMGNTFTNFQHVDKTSAMYILCLTKVYGRQ